MICLVLSDIHANLTAFETVLLLEAGHFDQIWCLGDVIGYGPDPNECIELLGQHEHVCVAGNHDLATLGRLDVEDFNTDARKATLWTRNALSPSSRSYLESLPATIQRDSITLVHGSPRQPAWEYVLHSAIAAANFPLMSTEICFVGHTHSPVIFLEQRFGGHSSVESLVQPCEESFRLNQGRLIVNPGSVGQPRDGDERASYILLDLAKQTILYRRVPYDISRTQARMHERGLPERLIARLSYGW